MATRKIKDAKDITTGERIYLKGHAKATYMSNGSTVEDSIKAVENATFKNKGYFKTFAELQRSYPVGSAGSKAYVGENYPYAIYVWDTSTGRWLDSGKVGGEETLNLNGYYTKDETHEAIKDEYEVIHQDVYDALEEKEEKLYFCYQ